MAKDDVGEVFIVTIADQLPKPVYIPNEDILATLEWHMSKLRRVGDTLAMTNVIISANDVTLTVQECSEFPIPLAIFGCAMRDLDDAPGIYCFWP